MTVIKLLGILDGAALSSAIAIAQAHPSAAPQIANVVIGLGFLSSVIAAAGAALAARKVTP